MLHKTVGDNEDWYGSSFPSHYQRGFSCFVCGSSQNELKVLFVACILWTAVKQYLIISIIIIEFSPNTDLIETLPGKIQ